MKKVLVAVLLVITVASMAVLTACGEKQVPAGSIAAVGESGTVTQAQFDAIIAQAKAAYAAQKVDFPAEGSADYNSIKANIVDYLVQSELIKQKAAELNLTVTTKELDERIAQIVKSVGGQKKYEQLLKQQGVTEEALRTQLEVQMLQEKVRTELGKSVNPTEADAKAYFEDPANKQQFVVAATATARHVLVKTKAEAEKVKALLVADGSNANWKVVAKKYSTDPGSKNKGGDLSSFSQGYMVTEFDKAVFSAKLKEIIGPVQTQFGYHVIEVLKRTKSSNTSFDEAKSGIIEQLKLKGQSEAWDKWLKEATVAAAIVYAAGFNPVQLTATPSAAPTTPASAATSASPAPSPSSSEGGN